MDLWHLGTRGISSAQQQLNITSKNIAQANDPHYSRQQLLQHTDTQGDLSHTTVRRHYDQWANAEVTRAKSDVGYHQTESALLAQFEQRMNGHYEGITTQWQTWQDSLAAWAEQPNDPSLRQLVLSQGNGVAEQYQAAQQSLTASQTEMQWRLQEGVSAINKMTSALAEINHQLTGQSGTPELFDKQAALLQDLSEWLPIKTVRSDDNTGSHIFTQDGQALVMGSKPIALSIGENAWQETQIEAEKPLVLSGSQGKLTAILNHKNQALPLSQAMLDRNATALREAMNQIQRSGVDANGNVGVAWFSEINDQAMTSQRAQVQADSQLSVSVSLNEINKAPTEPVVLTYQEGEWRDDANIAVNFSEDLGLDITIEGTPKSGEKIRISAFAGGVSGFQFQLTDANQLVAKRLDEGNLSNSGILDWMALDDAPIIRGQQSAMADLTRWIGQIGEQTAAVKVQSDLSEQRLIQASNRSAMVSGVNLDEEAANLMQFQQAYVASSKIITVAKETFDALLRIV